MSNFEFCLLFRWPDCSLEIFSVCQYFLLLTSHYSYQAAAGCKPSFYQARLGNELYYNEALLGWSRLV